MEHAIPINEDDTLDSPIISATSTQSANNKQPNETESGGPSADIQVEQSDDDYEAPKECDIFGALWEAFDDTLRKVKKGATDDDVQAFHDEIKECCEFQHDFDVYQVLAFESTDPNRDIIDLWLYRMKCLKGFLCALTQVVLHVD